HVARARVADAEVAHGARPAARVEREDHRWVADLELGVVAPHLGRLLSEQPAVAGHGGVEIAHIQRNVGRVLGHGRPPSSTDVDTVAHFIEVCQYPLMSMKAKGSPCCAPLLRTRIGRDDAEELAAAFKAIADPGRLRLLSYIAAQPGAE